MDFILKGYVGIVLDRKSREALLRSVRPMYSNLYADHVTLIFNPLEHVFRSTYEKFLSETVPVWAVEVVQDESCQVVPVVLGDLTVPCNNKSPHITISTEAGIPPKYSNDLLENREQSLCFSLKRPLCLKGKVTFVTPIHA